jgi:hypothetical protein
MSPNEPSDDSLRRDKSGDGEGNRDAVPSRLSEELNNWRRRRSNGGFRRRVDRVLSGGNFQSEPARTIKVRGHETLVIRKPKSSLKSPATPESTNQ